MQFMVEGISDDTFRLIRFKIYRDTKLLMDALIWFLIYRFSQA